MKDWSVVWTRERGNAGGAGALAFAGKERDGRMSSGGAAEEALVGGEDAAIVLDGEGEVDAIPKGELVAQGKFQRKWEGRIVKAWSASG